MLLTPLQTSCSSLDCYDCRMIIITAQGTYKWTTLDPDSGPHIPPYLTDQTMLSGFQPGAGAEGLGSAKSQLDIEI